MKSNGSTREISVRVGMTWHGQGASVLMLPALISISTRSEMWPLQQHLGSWFNDPFAITVMGFGVAIVAVIALVF